MVSPFALSFKLPGILILQTIFEQLMPQLIWLLHTET
jgi:hypothetical protein